MTIGDLKPGLRHSETIRVTDALAVPAQAQLFDPATEMPPVFATAQMIAFVEWACVHALAPYLAPGQRSVGTVVDMTHTAATPVGMTVTAEVELVEIDRRRLRFRASCRDEIETIGRGFTSAWLSTMRAFWSACGASGPKLWSLRAARCPHLAGARQRDADRHVGRHAEHHRRGSYQDPLHSGVPLSRSCEKNRLGREPVPRQHDSLAMAALLSLRSAAKIRGKRVSNL